MDLLASKTSYRGADWNVSIAGWALKPKMRSKKAPPTSWQASTTATIPRASKAVGVFIRILGTFVGNQALIQLPFGGIYLIGGVARAMAPHLSDFGFEAAFCDKGRFGDFMQSFPVRVIEDDYAALIGCASYLANTP